MDTELINDVLSIFTSYIVDSAANPWFLPQIRRSLKAICKDSDVDKIVSHIESLSGEIIAMSAKTKDYLNVYNTQSLEPYTGLDILIAAHNKSEADEIVDGINEESFRQYSHVPPVPIKGFRYIGEPDLIWSNYEP